jgi:anthranilate synthase/aminodeoxychorismate synthase-like glutamine amidotransferase
MAATYLLLDNFDSFTYNLVDYFKQLACECLVVRNNVSLQTIQDLEPTAIILSPGSGSPSKAGVMPELLAHYHNKVPILGICLGHQAIGEYFGGILTKAEKPMHGKISTIYCEPDAIFEGIPSQFQVVRYHSLVLSSVSAALRVLASTEKGEIMAIKHIALPIYGLQFHPEAVLTEYGINLLANWLKIANRS